MTLSIYVSSVVGPGRARTLGRPGAPEAGSFVILTGGSFALQTVLAEAGLRPEAADHREVDGEPAGLPVEPAVRLRQAPCLAPSSRYLNEPSLESRRGPGKRAPRVARIPHLHRHDCRWVRQITPIKKEKSSWHSQCCGDSRRCPDPARADSRFGPRRVITMRGGIPCRLTWC